MERGDRAHIVRFASGTRSLFELPISHPQYMRRNFPQTEKPVVFSRETKRELLGQKCNQLCFHMSLSWKVFVFEMGMGVGLAEGGDGLGCAGQPGRVGCRVLSTIS